MSEPLKRRKWLRLVVAAALLVVVGVPVSWWLLRDGPLTEEEQRFVGCWAPSGDPTIGPIGTVALELRPDRTVRYLRQDAVTGAQYWEDIGVRWHAADGNLVMAARVRHPARLLAAGGVRQTVRADSRVTWENPDRVRMDRTDAPPGVQYPATVLTRRPAPEYP